MSSGRQYDEQPTSRGRPKDQFLDVQRALYNSLYSECELHKSDISPGGYRGSPIAIQGISKAALQYKDHSDTDKVYISKKGATILGFVMLFLVGQRCSVYLPRDEELFR